MDVAMAANVHSVRRWPIRLGQRDTDVLVTVVVAAVCVFGVQGELADAHRPVAFPVGGYLLAVCAAAALVARRRAPLVSAITVTALVAAYFLLGYPAGAPLLALIVAAYSVGAYGDGRWSLVVGSGLAVAASVLPVLAPHQVWPLLSVDTLLVVCAVAGLVFAGDAVRLRRRAVEADKAAAARVAVAEDRVRVAREVHDILAHTATAIVVQAGLAADALADDPEQTRSALAAIRDAARGAIDELGATIEPLGTDSQPGLARLPVLADAVRAGGLRVELAVGGVDANPSTGYAAYRIVQEALTNVVRHAHARTARVAIREAGGELEIRVTDDGDTLPGAAILPGRGLTGMAERAHRIGGTLRAAPLSGGGFEVLARLPLETS